MAPLKTSLLTAALAAVVSLTLFASPAAAKKPCWKEIVDDYFVDGRIDYTYPIHCYREALAHLPEQSEAYSSARDDISNAMLAAIHGRGPNGPPDVGAPATAGKTPTSELDTGKHEGFLSSVIHKLGPQNADAIPLPLLVLGGTALLLLAAAGASVVAKRMQARRIEVAPAPVRAEPKSQ
jgi:hypothetical protein